jgi:hypothetical protein
VSSRPALVEVMEIRAYWVIIWAFKIVDSCGPIVIQKYHTNLYSYQKSIRVPSFHFLLIYC